MSRAIKGSKTRKTADTLERGDVFDYDGYRVVLIEASDRVHSLPLDQSVKFVIGPNRSRTYKAVDLCEPRICFLGKTGRATHEATYILVPNRQRFNVVAFLDLDVRGATPKPLSEET